jgi:hypothetical protein
MTQKTVCDLALYRTNTYVLLGFSLAPAGSTSRAPAALRRAGTIARSPLDGRKDKEKGSDGDIPTQEVRLHCSLRVDDLSSGLDLWESPGANLPPDISRRRVHCRLLADQ